MVLIGTTGGGLTAIYGAVITIIGISQLPVAVTGRPAASARRASGHHATSRSPAACC